MFGQPLLLFIVRVGHGVIPNKELKLNAFTVQAEILFPVRGCSG